MTTPRIALGHLNDIPRQGARIVQTSTGEIAVFRTLDDQIFALDNRCPHKGGPLAQGIVHGTHVTCPLHGWVINLDSGNAVAPDEGCVSRYHIDNEDGMLYLKKP